MRKLITICIWELQKLLGDWKKSLAVFLLPAVLMLGALILFPTLVNYLSTGSLGRTVVVSINAPSEFEDYIEENLANSSYKFDEMSVKEFQKINIDGEGNKNKLFVVFNPVNNEVLLTYSDTAVMENKAGQFIEDVLKPYGQNMSEDILYNIDSFNPVKSILDNRAIANAKASLIIPQLIVLLMYYTVYSLGQDIFQGDLQRGFLTKLKMTPVSLKSIVYGKMIAIISTSVVAAILTFLMLFIASWINTANDPFSLIPYGLLLLPGEVLLLLVGIIITSTTMTFIVTLIIFSLQKSEDITINLQFPLVLILVEVFLMMVREGFPALLEYALPIHSGIVILRDAIHAEIRPLQLIVFIVSNIWIIYITNSRIWKKEFFNGQLKRK